MTRVQQEFDDRVTELDAYIQFIANVDSGGVQLRDASGQNPAYTTQAKDDLLRTSKASALLLLYNLMESTVSNAVEAIYDEMASKGVAFDSCRKEVRRIILSNVKQHDTDMLVPVLLTISTDIVNKTFRKDGVVSGNVDAKQIKKIAAKYGFNKPRADGRDLLTVKTNRNDLAHGVKSFAEVGRAFVIQDILDLKDKVVAYLRALLICVAQYITQAQYLAAPNRP